MLTDKQPEVSPWPRVDVEQIPLTVARVVAKASVNDTVISDGSGNAADAVDHSFAGRANAKRRDASINRELAQLLASHDETTVGFRVQVGTEYPCVLGIAWDKLLQRKIVYLRFI